MSQAAAADPARSRAEQVMFPSARTRESCAIFGLMNWRSVSARTLVALSLLLPAWVGPLHAAPEGTMTWGVHFTLAARWLDPGEIEGVITPFMVLYALHDALVKPMRGSLTTPSLAGHHDHAADLEGLRNLKTAGGISARVYDKIVDANPRAAYTL
jgi:hypothetical protein